MKKRGLISAMYAMTMLFSAFVLVSPSVAIAQANNCLPGIPCVIPKTDNPTPLNPNPDPSPNRPPDGPNATGKPNALKTDSNTCDADFMNQIHARAFLEASREVMMNQTVIRKPDSVMQYSCFDTYLGDTGQKGGTIFSSSSRWQGVSVPDPEGGSITLNVSMGSGRLDQSIQKLVKQSLQSYTSSNFSSGFLGGTATGVSADCGTMNSVFTLAKCNNFTLDDQPLKFADMIGKDIRNVFGGSSCTSDITQQLMDVAGNKDFNHANYDPARTFIELVGYDGSKAKPCAPPIQTGLEVVLKTFQTDVSGDVIEKTSKIFKDSVCPNPGCYFTGSACEARP